jgi:glycosyltransferase involved in cell wall biosynthesis
MLPNQLWVHKNHRVAFEAIKVLTGRGLDVHLVCTGKDEDPRRPEHGQRLRWFIKEHRLTDRVHMLGLIPRLDQIQLMRAATAIVQPSLFEGLSTVVEDARALGKRMFLSEIPVHREQNPDNASYFNPYRPDLLATEIAKVWDSLPDGPCAADEKRAASIQPKRVRRYAREFLKIGRELLRSSRRR